MKLQSKSTGSVDGLLRWRPPAAEYCGIRQLLHRMGDKWSLLILFVLRDGSMRFNALKRHIDSISQRMLTTTLRSLERDGLISRTATPGLVPEVSYALTPFGRELVEHTKPLTDWANAFDHKVTAARCTFDTRHIDN